MKKLILLIAIVVASVWLLPTGLRNPIFGNTHKTPPEGYGVACDGHGHYAMAWLANSEHDLIVDDPHVFASRKEAMDHIWKYFEWSKQMAEDAKNHPAPHYDMHVCKETN